VLCSHEGVHHTTVAMRKLQQQWDEDFDMDLCTPYWVDGEGFRIEVLPNTFTVGKEMTEELEKRIALARRKRKMMEEQVKH
jgi:hypothetical protein